MGKVVRPFPFFFARNALTTHPNMKEKPEKYCMNIATA